MSRLIKLKETRLQIDQCVIYVLITALVANDPVQEESKLHDRFGEK